ncbi:MAG: VTT domain-containing protein [Anaerolineales bacterium]|nr:VTT domain-containing protein [Anaerolineales bacterium]
MYYFYGIAQTLPQPLGIWAYILLALMVAIEGPIITLTGAAAASAGLLNPVWVFIFASLGNMTADILWYLLGYFGKMELVTRYGIRFGIKESFITRIQKDIHTHIHKVLFVAKMTMGLVIPTLVAAGLARVPFKLWFGILFTAECIWTGGLVLAGYYFGSLIQSIETNLRWVALGGAVALLIAVIYYLSHRKLDLESEM